MLRDKQIAAIASITARPDGITELASVATRVPVPMHLGSALAERDEIALADVVPWMTTEPGPLRDAAAGWVQSKLRLYGATWLADTLDDLTTDLQARHLVLLQVSPTSEYWPVIDRSEADRDFYWTNARIDVVGRSDVREAVSELTSRQRPWSAIAVLPFALFQRADREAFPVDTEVVIAVLRAALGEEPRPPDRSTMSSHHVGQLLDYLAAEGVDLAILAPLEFAYYRFLEHDREPKALKRALAGDQRLFVDLVKRVYRGKTQTPETSTEVGREESTHAWWVLNGWKGFPGQQEDGTLDADAMNAWVDAARLELSDVDRADIGDELIGQTFAYCPLDADGAWPAIPVRDMIERIGSKDMENGFVVGKLNSRGVTTRGVYDGGKLERDEAAKYRAWSKAASARWPRTSRILRDLAESYERDARRQDIEAEIHADQG